MSLSIPVDDYMYCSKAAGKSEGTGFIRMPVVHGESLAAAINSARNSQPLRCSRDYIHPTPSVHGSLSTALQEELERGIKELNKHGIFTLDFHAGNAIVQPDGKVVFIDFGLVWWCVKKESPIVAWALGRLGCGVAGLRDGHGLDIPCIDRGSISGLQ